MGTIIRKLVEALVCITITVSVRPNNRVFRPNINFIPYAISIHVRISNVTNAVTVKVAVFSFVVWEAVSPHGSIP
jgi:hypothetical protein